MGYHRLDRHIEEAADRILRACDWYLAGDPEVSLRTILACLIALADLRAGRGDPLDVGLSKAWLTAYLRERADRG